ncbi:hypothetical protein KAI87_09360 [Myxococcota bacterium]|nr:hypothetical protein [Myxococcota bacterium]
MNASAPVALGADGAGECAVLFAVGASSSVALRADGDVQDKGSVLAAADASSSVALGADGAFECAVLFTVGATAPFTLGAQMGIAHE